MKKILLTFAAILLTCGVFAQTESKNNKPASHRHPNGYMIKDGRLMQVKDGNIMLIEKDITLSNGTILMADGNYTVKGKSKAKLNDDEYIDPNGNLVSGAQPKSK